MPKWKTSEVISDQENSGYRVPVAEAAELNNTVTVIPDADVNIVG